MCHLAVDILVCRVTLHALLLHLSPFDGRSLVTAAWSRPMKSRRRVHYDDQHKRRAIILACHTESPSALRLQRDVLLSKHPQSVDINNINNRASQSTTSERHPRFPRDASCTLLSACTTSNRSANTVFTRAPIEFELPELPKIDWKRVSREQSECVARRRALVRARKASGAPAYTSRVRVM